MTERKSTSPWVWVAAGCGCLVLVVVAAAIVVAAFFYRTVQDWEATLKDPASRAEKTREILGYERPPEGYHPLIGLSIPFMLDVAVLADRELDEQGEIPADVERAVFYVRLSTLLARDKELRAILDGRADPSSLLEQANMRIQGGEVVGEGTLTIGDQEVRYLAQRGELILDNRPVRGILTLVFVNCPGGRRPGVGGWLAPDPAPGRPRDGVDFTATPADPRALADLFSSFTLCK